MLSASSSRLRYPRTSIWRLTVLFTALSLVVNALVLGTVYWLTVSERERQLQHNVLVAADTFRQLTALGTNSEAGLRRVVEAHARGAANTLLALDADGQLVGNLSEFPPRLPQYPSTGRFPVAVSRLSGEVAVEMARGTWLEVGAGRLMVAQLEADPGDYRGNFLLASVLALALALLLTLFIGYLFNRRQVKRLRGLSDGIERIQQGRMDTRLYSSGNGDEFDILAGQVNHMLDEIDELLHSVAGVTDNIAHDLRTPLSRIQLRLEDVGAALQGQGERSHPQAQTVAEAQADMQQLLATFDAMLELARLEQGVLQFEGEPCDLAKISTDVAELLGPVAEEKDQHLQVQVTDGSRVTGDPSLLFRAVYNLLDNAIRHAGQGARVTLSQGAAHITVSDNGPGIPEGERERVFRRLYRLDQSRHHSGTGLGLSVVRAIARLHGATITLTDANPGLSVTLDFPLEDSV